MSEHQRAEAGVTSRFHAIRELFDAFVAPTYGRFPLAFDRGEGCRLWDVDGREYLDFGSGIAVCCLGHAHPELAESLAAQARRLLHVSNLYYHEWQGRLAERIVRLIGPGRVFFANSGAEANEGLYKLARRFGHQEGRFEILTTTHSFHGRTLAGIAATGQTKVKQGFGPMVPGFRHVPFNDLEAVEAAISPATVAVLIEGVQGEGGITPARPDYLLGLRRLCDQKRLLLMIDAVQCGYFRTGRFQSFQRLLEGVPGSEGFLPDAVSMAKSLGGGLPLGAFWIREDHKDLLGPGSHATTFGGSPLVCAGALKVLEIVERDQLERNARDVGAFLKQELEALRTRYPAVIRDVRGLGLMLGVEFASADQCPALRGDGRPVSLQIVERLHQAGLLTVPAGAQVVRFLPPLNITREDAAKALAIFGREVERLAEEGASPAVSR